jgi:hypothetical protein
VPIEPFLTVSQARAKAAVLVKDADEFAGFVEDAANRNFS